MAELVPDSNSGKIPTNYSSNLIDGNPAYPNLGWFSNDVIGQICDVDGDGQDELVTSTRSGGPSIVTLDGAGEVKRRITPPEGATEWALGPTGAMGADPAAGRWIIGRYRTAFETWRVLAYDGGTSEQLWMRHGYGFYGETPTQFGLHIPTAVYDYNGDGAEDMVVASENFAGILSVADNRDLVSYWNVSNLVPGHWTAYATPIVAAVTGDRPEIVFGRSFALSLVTSATGGEVWHYGLTRDTTARALPGLADLDGDGKLEVITSQADGFLRAFNATTTDPNKVGNVRWALQLTGPVSDFATADLDANGRHELLVGAGDGKLYAIGEAAGAGEIFWSYEFGRRVGSPVVVDLNDDGRPEILAPVEDGKIYALEGSKTAVRPWVWTSD